MNEFAYFTSEAACSRVAERAIREQNDSTKMASLVLKNSILTPMSKKLFASGRHKLQRGTLKMVVRSAVNEISKNEMIFDVRLKTLSGTLSSNESYHLHFLIAQGEGERWIDFVSCDLVLTRHNIQASISSTNFRVRKHVLVRYMQRERKPLSEFFKEIIEPLTVSAALGSVLTYTDQGNGCDIALPIGNGLLFGDVVKLESSEENPHEDTIVDVVIFDGDGCESMQRLKTTLTKGIYPHVEIRTYVDRDAMTDSRSDLHQTLTNFVNKNKEGLNKVYETIIIQDRFILNSDEMGETANLMVTALKNAAMVVTSKIWQRFVSSVGRS
jgi:hypothetical protein